MIKIRIVSSNLAAPTIFKIRAGVLIEAERLAGEANAQERALGGVETRHAEAAGLMAVLELLDARLAAGELVIPAAMGLNLDPVAGAP